MRFSLKQVFFAITAISAFFFVGTFWSFRIALVIATLIVLVALFYSRTRKHWNTSFVLQRIYGCGMTAALSCLLAWIIVFNVTDPKYAVRRMNNEYRKSNQFHKVELEVIDLRKPKVDVLFVTGSVDTETDFRELRRKLSEHPWYRLYGIYWNLTIKESGRTYMHEQYL